MIRFLMFSFCILQTAFCGASDFEKWGWGVGFGVKSDVQSSVNLEFKSPQLWGTDSVGSLYLSVASHQTTYTKPAETDVAYMYPVRLLAEFRRPTFKEIVSGYWRIGAGYMFADKYIHSNRGYFMIPVQFGLDVIMGANDGNSLSTFFAQVGFDAAFDNKVDQPVDKLNGTEVILGVRLYY